MISRVIPATLKTEKNREGYKEVTEALKMASGERILKAPVEKRVSDLYDRRPPLPALKEKLCKAGFLPLASPASGLAKETLPVK